MRYYRLPLLSSLGLSHRSVVPCPAACRLSLASALQRRCTSLSLICLRDWYRRRYATSTRHRHGKAEEEEGLVAAGGGSIRIGDGPCRRPAAIASLPRNFSCGAKGAGVTRKEGPPRRQQRRARATQVAATRKKACSTSQAAPAGCSQTVQAHVGQGSALAEGGVTLTRS